LKRVRTGLEELLARPSRIKGDRLGLIANPTAVTPDLTHAALHFKVLRGAKLVALFGPEHGVFANAQDLEEVGDLKDPKTGLKVFSLYGETRIPTPRMLAGIDTLIFDIQDVGSRYYTFIYTMLHAIQACAAHGVRLIVLDRPNPIGGLGVQGNVLDPRFLSFVGLHPLAVRHGMTVGELALMFADELDLSLDLEIVPMKNYRRAMDYEDTGLPWVLPSPNMPTVDTAYVYPGGCLIEGTNLSEGRGTTRPFHLVGAPWLDTTKVLARLRAADLPGVRFAGVRFRPKHPGDGKYADTKVSGIRLRVTDRSTYDPTATAITMLAVIRAVHPGSFRWSPAQFDRLAGTDEVRLDLASGAEPGTVMESWPGQVQAFVVRRQAALLYPRIPSRPGTDQASP